MWPLLLRPECFLRTSISERSGSFFVISLKSAVVMNRRAAEVGLYFFTAILLLEVVHAAESDLLPRSDGDDGFFPVGLHPAGALAAAREVLFLAAYRDGVDLEHGHAEALGDRGLDLRLRRAGVHLEGVLLRGGPRPRLLADQRSDDAVSRFHLLLLPGELRREGVVRGGGEHEPAVADHVLHVELAGVGDGDALQVAPGAAERGADPGQLFGREHDQRARPVLRRLRRTEQQDGERLGLRHVELGGVEHGDAAALELVGERGAHRGAAFLLVQARDVRAGLRSEDHAAVRPLRRTDRTLAGAAGPLLAPRLLAAAAHFVALLRRRGAGAGICQLAEDRAIDRIGLAVGRTAERSGRLLFAHDLALRVDHLRHYAVAFTLTDCCTMTSPFFGPGTGPRTSSRFRSASARTISRFWCVMRSTP